MMKCLLNLRIILCVCLFRNNSGTTNQIPIIMYMFSIHDDWNHQCPVYINND